MSEQVRVECFVCGKGFLVLRKDVEAEEWYRRECKGKSKGHPKGGAVSMYEPKEWFCSMACFGKCRDELHPPRVMTPERAKKASLAALAGRRREHG